MATASDLITRALRTLVVVPGTATPRPEDLATGLDYLNELLRSWELESIYVPVVEIVDQVLDQAKRDYTWGTGGDWDNARPSQVLSAHIIDAAGNAFPLSQINYDEWGDIREKQHIGRPLNIWLDYDHPLMTARFDLYPIDPCVRFMVRGTLPSPSLVTDTLTLHPGYDAAIRYNLAVAMAPEYDVGVTPDLRKLALQHKRIIGGHNLKNPTASIDPALAPGRSSVGNWFV